MTHGFDASRRVLIPQNLPANARRGADSGLELCCLAGKTMGTFWSASVQLPKGLDSPQVQTALVSAFDQVIRQMSHWDESSELCRFNRAAAGTWQVLSPGFFHVLTRALEVAAASDGACDPTLGEIVNLHGHGPVPAGDSLLLPAARARSGWQKLHLDRSVSSALQPGGLKLDLSSIAKGYAVDLAADRLVRLGVSDFLIEIGGELRGLGCKPDGEPWWVSLAPPPGSDLPETIVALCGLSVATSGDAFRRHLVDPRTAQPADGSLAAVTVFARDCIDADAWATAFFIAGPDEGPLLAERLDFAALFTVRSLGGPTERWTPAFAAMAED